MIDNLYRCRNFIKAGHRINALVELKRVEEHLAALEALVEKEDKKEPDNG